MHFSLLSFSGGEDACLRSIHIRYTLGSLPRPLGLQQFQNHEWAKTFSRFVVSNVCQDLCLHELVSLKDFFFLFSFWWTLNFPTNRRNLGWTPKHSVWKSFKKVSFQIKNTIYFLNYHTFIKISRDLKIDWALLLRPTLEFTKYILPIKLFFDGHFWYVSNTVNPSQFHSQRESEKVFTNLSWLFYLPSYAVKTL